MNNNDFDNSIKKLQHIQLSEAEHVDVRNELSSYIDNNAPVVSSWVGILSPLQQIKKSALVMAMFFFVIGGISLSAEEAVPGDSLYAVKVNVNERFMRIASLNNDVLVAQNQSRITSRRIAELEELAARGTLDSQVSQRLTTAISQHTQSAREHIKAASDAGEVSTALSLETELVSTLNTHGDILEKLGVRDDGSHATTTFAAASELRNLAQDKAQEDVSVTVARAQSIEVRSNDGESISPAQAEKLLERTADRLHDVRGDFQDNYDAFADEELGSNMEELLLRAANEMDDAINSMDAGNYDTAKSSLRKALTYTHEVSIIIEVSKSFDLSEKRSNTDEDNDSTGTSTPDTAVSTSTATTSTSSEGEGEGKQDVAGTSTATSSDNPVATSSATSSVARSTSSGTEAATVSDAVGGNATDTVNQNLKKEWATDSEAYTRINQVLERVNQTLQTSTTSSSNGVLPSRAEADEEN